MDRQDLSGTNMGYHESTHFEHKRKGLNNEHFLESACVEPMCCWMILASAMAFRALVVFRSWHQRGIEGVHAHWKRWGTFEPRVAGRNAVNERKHLKQYQHERHNIIRGWYCGPPTLNPVVWTDCRLHDLRATFVQVFFVYIGQMNVLW